MNVISIAVGGNVTINATAIAIGNSSANMVLSVSGISVNGTPNFGPQGPNGPQGSQGSMGSQGPTGAQGPQGTSGVSTSNVTLTGNTTIGNTSITGTVFANGAVTIANSSGNNIFFLTNGNVGFGNNAPSERLEVAGSVRLDDGNADGPQLKLASSGYSDWNIDNFSGTLRAYYGASEKFNITSAGVVDLLAGQIKFPASQSASTDVNTLDDYEEGTWTVTLTASTPGTLSVSYGNRAAWYTKIGRQVIAGFYLTWSMTKGNASGDILLSGLPFTAAVPFSGADAQTGFIGYVNSFPVSVCGLLQMYTTNNMYIGIANGGTAPITSFADGTTYAVRGTYVFYV